MFTDQILHLTEMLMYPASSSLFSFPCDHTFDQQSDKQHDMKTLKVLTTAFLLSITLSAFAADHSAVKTNGVSVSSPAIIWGDPSDVNAESVETLKKATISFPTPMWGSSDDVFNNSVESLKSVIANPEMDRGNADDVNLPSVEALKQIIFFENPEMVWGDANDINLFSPGSLKNINNSKY
jgi:hypothetical protein